MTSATTSATWKEYWSSLQVGECVEQGNMQLFGLRHGMRPAIDYLTLERALKVGKGEEFRVDEVSVGGSVTDLKVHNGLDSPVLLVEGEILLGAKQNRTVYTTILVDKKSDIIIPVACVEQGRWSHRPAAKFALSDQYAHSSLRYAKLAFLGKVRATGGAQASGDRRRAYPVDQGGVWDEVQSYQARSDAHSPTSSADEAYRTVKERLGEPIDFTCPRDCSGIAVTIDGRLAGIECFDRPDTMEKVFPRLIQSYITEAMLRKVVSGERKSAGTSDREAGTEERNRKGWFDYFRKKQAIEVQPDTAGQVTPDTAKSDAAGADVEEKRPLPSAAVESFLRDVAESKVTSAAGVGMGEDLRAQASDWSAAVLTYENSGLHGQVLLVDDSTPGTE